MSGFAYLNIIIIFLALVLFFFVAKIAWKFLKQRRLIWLLAVYIIVLLSSPLVLSMLPEGNFIDMNIVSESTLKTQEGSWVFFEYAMAGKPEEFDGGVHKIEEWEFEFTEDNLEIAGIDSESDLSIFVERKDIKDGKIEATAYEAKTIVERIDVTDERQRPKLFLESNRLSITNLGHTEIKMAKFNKEFIFAQLESEKIGPESPDSRGTVIGWQAIYIKIPRDVEIKKAHPYITFVDQQDMPNIW